MENEKNFTAKIIRDEVKRLFATLRPFVELPDSTVQNYCDALDDISGPEAVVMANIAIRTKWAYLPQPAELREIVAKLRESEPHQEVPIVCALCEGTKFRRVRLHENYLAAVPCSCVSDPSQIATWIKSRQFNPQNVNVMPNNPVFVDKPKKDQKLYLAKDCLEGREFLAALKALKETWKKHA